MLLVQNCRYKWGRGGWGVGRSLKAHFLPFRCNALALRICLPSLWRSSPHFESPALKARARFAAGVAHPTQAESTNTVDGLQTQGGRQNTHDKLKAFLNDIVFEYWPTISQFFMLLGCFLGILYLAWGSVAGWCRSHQPTTKRGTKSCLPNHWPNRR